MTAPSTTSRLVGLYAEASKARDEAIGRTEDLVLMVLAGETVTLFGQRAQITTITWPDGLPMGYTDEAELRALCSQWLAERRTQRQPG